MHTFCTYFDSNYLDKGLCLWDSLRSLGVSARLYVCCLDDAVHGSLTAFGKIDVVPVRLSEVEALYPALLDAKPTRSKVEYFFTLTPSWIRYVFDTTDEEAVTYVDSDLLFFADPQPLFDEFDDKGGHVAIIGHRFVERLRHLTVYGTYNVGWLTFRRSRFGMDCLLDWQQKCLDWCYDRLEGDRFADQRYLDAWPTEHQGVVVLEHPGANVALWNFEPGTIKRRGGRLHVHGQPLIFYHFHGLSQIGRRVFYTSARLYGAKLDRVARWAIYRRYLRLLTGMQRSLRIVGFQPLLRYKHTAEDVKYARTYPLSGNFFFLFRPLLGMRREVRPARGPAGAGAEAP